MSGKENLENKDVTKHDNLLEKFKEIEKSIENQKIMIRDKLRSKEKEFQLRKDKIEMEVERKRAVERGGMLKLSKKGPLTRFDSIWEEKEDGECQNPSICTKNTKLNYKYILSILKKHLLYYFIIMTIIETLIIFHHIYITFYNFQCSKNLNLIQYLIALEIITFTFNN